MRARSIIYTRDVAESDFIRSSQEYVFIDDHEWYYQPVIPFSSFQLIDSDRICTYLFSSLIHVDSSTVKSRMLEQRIDIEHAI